MDLVWYFSFFKFYKNCFNETGFVSSVSQKKKPSLFLFRLENRGLFYFWTFPSSAISWYWFIFRYIVAREICRIFAAFVTFPLSLIIASISLFLSSSPECLHQFWRKIEWSQVISFHIEKRLLNDIS